MKHHKKIFKEIVITEEVLNIEKEDLLKDHHYVLDHHNNEIMEVAS